LSNKTILRKIKMLEKAFMPPDDKLIIIEMWRPDSDERFFEWIDEAALKIQQGEKLVTVPLGGIVCLRKQGVI